MTEQSVRPLCKIPDFVQFQYYPEQEIHAAIQIQNLRDQIVTFKIKTNTPAEYLVKPMEGQIYKKQKMRIIFRRKKLQKEVFDQYINTNFTKQKFLFTFKCKSKNAIGIQKVDEKTQYMQVKFIMGKKTSSKVIEPSPKKITKQQSLQKQKKTNMLSQKLKQQQQKLRKTIQTRKKQENALNQLQQTISGTNKESTLQHITIRNIICLIIMAFLIGFLI